MDGMRNGKKGPCRQLYNPHNVSNGPVRESSRVSLVEAQFVYNAGQPPLVPNELAAVAVDIPLMLCVVCVARSSVARVSTKRINAVVWLVYQLLLLLLVNLWVPRYAEKTTRVSACEGSFPFRIACEGSFPC